MRTRAPDHRPAETRAMTSSACVRASARALTEHETALAASDPESEEGPMSCCGSSGSARISRARLCAVKKLDYDTIVWTRAANWRSST